MRGRVVANYSCSVGREKTMGHCGQLVSDYPFEHAVAQSDSQG